MGEGCLSQPGKGLCLAAESTSSLHLTSPSVTPLLCCIEKKKKVAVMGSGLQMIKHGIRGRLRHVCLGRDLYIGYFPAGNKERNVHSVERLSHTEAGQSARWTSSCGVRVGRTRQANLSRGTSFKTACPVQPGEIGGQTGARREK